jgi:hypothetical protein
MQRVPTVGVLIKASLEYRILQAGSALVSLPFTASLSGNYKSWFDL